MPPAAHPPSEVLHAAPDGSAETRTRLLEAAGEIFAEQGYRAATVRDICRHASANVAAIHYHFGDKGALYAEVLRYSFQLALAKYPPLLDTGAGAPAGERLHAFIHSFLLRILDPSRPAWHGRIMLREFADPSPALSHIIENGIRPLYNLLKSILRDLIHETNPATRPTNEHLDSLAASVLGQCLIYKHAQPVFAQLMQAANYDEASIRRIANHVAAFSMSAIAGMVRERVLKAGPRSPAPPGRSRK